MRKDDRGRARNGGILVDDAAHRAPTAAVPAQPGGSRASASGEKAAPGSPGTAADPAEAAGPASAAAASAPGAGEPAGDAGNGPASGAPPDGRENPGEAAGGPAPGGHGTGGAGATGGTDGPAGTPPDQAPGVDPGRPGRPGGADQPAGAGPGAGDDRSVAVRAPRTATRPAPVSKEPSWGRVLATTISLWTSRRLRRLGIGRRRPSRWGVSPYRERAGRARARGGWRWWPLVALVLAVVILVLVALLLSGALSTSQAPRAAAPRGSGSVSGGTSSLSAAVTARDQAAGWAAKQVSSDKIIACDPAMCSALQSRGLPAGRLLPLQPAGSDPFGADVIVASPAVRNEFGSQLTNVFAPALIASFGSGSTRVDVRAIAGQGGAAYRAAAPADLQARKTAGTQLLHNQRFQATAQAAGQMKAGQVDSRLLVTLAALASQHAISVTSFGDTGPRAPASYRQVTVTSPGGRAALTAALNQVRAQSSPYLPATATIVQHGGQPDLVIEFGAPGVQGLLSGVASP